MKQQDRDVAVEIIKGILELKKADKSRGDYERITPAYDGAVHCSQNPGGTETQRLSHASSWFFEPGSTNLANLAKKVALLDPLYNLRECIVPHPGRVLGKADYSQAEARWCAWIAGDEQRIQMYKDGIDQYKFFVAMLKWEDPDRIDEVTKAERNSIGKVGVLSGQYKATWRTHLTKVNKDYDIHGVTIDAKTAKRMEGLYPELWPQTPRWWKEIEKQVLGKGYVINPFGLKRLFFGRNDSQNARDKLVREAIAFVPQSSNAMMLNRALADLYEEYDPELLWIHLNVHDEIVFSCRREDLARVARIVKGTMEQEVNVNGRSLLIPAEVEASSTSWAETKRVA